ncbi:MAG: MFS transporter [Deltaproteobacteria bacterium]|nr:MFS transporter [Deltaproteobacteria bacterium]
MQRRTLLSFGASGFAQNVIGTCLGVHLFVFYTDVAGLAPLWVSAGLIVATLWDAVSDLAMGRISDATRFAAGRRRPYIFLGAVPVGLSFVMLLGGYHERTRLAAARELLGNVGDLVGLLLPIVLLMVIAGPEGASSGASDPDVARAASARAFTWAAWVGGGLAAVALLITVFGTRERAVAPRAPAAPLADVFRALRGNPAFRALLGASCLAALAFAFVQSLVIYVMEHVMNESDPKVHLAAFVTNAVFAILSYPFWTRLARRFGKPFAFRAGLALSSVTFASVFFVGPGAHVLLFVVMAFSGAANVGFWMMLHALNADVTDLDELAHGERREGLFAGFAALVRKVGFALAAAGVGVGLTLVGYQAGSAPSAGTVEGLRLLFAVPPTALIVGALVLFRRFELTRESHAQVRAALATRAGELCQVARVPDLPSLASPLQPALTRSPTGT